MKFVSLRALSIALVVIALTVGAFSIFLNTQILRTDILEFIGSETLPAELESWVRDQLIAQGAVTFGMFLFIGLLILFAMERLIIRPLQKLSRNMRSFGEDIDLREIEPVHGAPYEVQHLYENFFSMARQVEEAQEQSEEISRTKSDFISTAAHQLRTPLTGIRWTLEALSKDEHLTDEHKEMLKSALEKNRHLVSIVRTLLDVSAIESGRYKYNFAAVEMPVLVDEVIEELEEHAERQGVHVQFKLPEYAPDVWADRERIRWVLINLIENAIRYTPQGGSVTVSITPELRHLYIYVRDTGIGIPQDERGSIFERFYRGSNAAKMQNEGNGLGLYVARNVVRDHGGDLTFRENPEGTGTEFFFSLPVVSET
mgnify:CR=1 FL=1